MFPFSTGSCSPNFDVGVSSPNQVMWGGRGTVNVSSLLLVFKSVCVCVFVHVQDMNNFFGLFSFRF